MLTYQNLKIKLVSKIEILIFFYLLKQFLYMNLLFIITDNYIFYDYGYKRASNALIMKYLCKNVNSRHRQFHDLSNQ